MLGPKKIIRIALDQLAFFDVSEIAEEHATNFTHVQVQCETKQPALELHATPTTSQEEVDRQTKEKRPWPS